jgi:hypothetical protein
MATTRDPQTNIYGISSEKQGAQEQTFDTDSLESDVRLLLAIDAKVGALLLDFIGSAPELARTDASRYVAGYRFPWVTNPKDFEVCNECLYFEPIYGHCA